MHSVETGSPGKVNTFVTHTATVAWAIATLTPVTGYFAPDVTFVSSNPQLKRIYLFTEIQNC